MSSQLQKSVTAITGEYLAERAEEFIQAAKATNTVRAYKADWRHFELWCMENGLQSLPAHPTTICMYLTTYADSLTVGTLSRRLTTIREAHRAAGYEPLFADDPTLKALWSGIKRTKGVAQHGKAPLLTDDIHHLVQALTDGLKGTRDRALLLVGFAGAFRRSELVGLDVSDLTFTGDGVQVSIRRSKTDQEGAGQIKAIPYGSHPDLCPVRAVAEWLRASGQLEGPVFVSIGKGGRLSDRRVSDRAVALLIQGYAEKAGLDATKFAGHSLRSGFVTQAAKNGASDREIMNQTGHRTRTMVDHYVRTVNIWQENGATRLGL